jgi:exodeoxyribonuclease VII small subunit
MPILNAASTANPAPVSTAPAANPASYELALAELDRLVAQMESGQLPLDQLLEGYRRGAELIGFCRQQLQSVEEQVKVLEDGQLKSWPGPAA